MYNCREFRVLSLHKSQIDTIFKLQPQKVSMKKHILSLTIFGLLFASAATAAAHQGTTQTQSKKGGVEAKDKHVKVEGKKGGGMKIDKSGMEIKGKKGGGVNIEKKKKG